MRRYTALGVWREKTFGSFNANIDSNTEEEKFQTVIAESGVDDAASSRVLPVVWRVWSNHPVHVASLVKTSPFMWEVWSNHPLDAASLVKSSPYFLS